MNVLHFDTFDDDLYTQLSSVFNAAGIPLPRSRAALLGGKAGAENVRIEVAVPEELPKPVKSTWPFIASSPSSSSSRSASYNFLEPRRWDMAAPAASPFGPEEHRLESFTHLVRSWNVHSNKSGSYYSTAKSLVTLDSPTSSSAPSAPSVHVLTTSPVTLHNFYDTLDSTLPPTRQSIDFDSELPYYLPTNPAPVLCPLPEQDKLMVFFPSASMFLAMDPRTGKGVYVKLPEPTDEGSEGEEGEGAASSGAGILSSVFGGGKSKRKKTASADWKACEDLVGENKVLLHQEGGQDVCLVEFDNGSGIGCRWLRVDANITSLTCASSKEFYARGDDGSVTKIALGDDSSHGGPLQYSLAKFDGGGTTSCGSGGGGSSSWNFPSAALPPPHLSEFGAARALVSDDTEYATR